MEFLEASWRWRGPNLRRSSEFFRSLFVCCFSLPSPPVLLARKQKQIEEERAKLKKKEEDARIVREKYAREKAEKLALKSGSAVAPATAAAVVAPSSQPKASASSSAAATGPVTIQVRVPNQSPVVVNDLKGDSTLQDLYARVDALTHGISAACVLTVPFPPPPKQLFRDDASICNQTLHQLGLTPRAALVLTELASLGKVAQGKGEMPNAHPPGMPIGRGGGGMIMPPMPMGPGFGRGRGGGGVGFGGGGGGQPLGGGGGGGGAALPIQQGGIDVARTVESRYLKKPGVDQECRICQGSLNDGDTIRTLPCMHVFHGECLEEWAENNAECPDCQ